MKKYIETMYRPSYIALCIGLFIFSALLIATAVSLRYEMLLGESDLIYRYPKMIEKILFPLYIFVPITMIVDLNERQRKG